MGRIKKRGVVGEMSGVVGDVVISKWNETTVVKSRPRKSTKPATQAQLEQYAKMAKVVGFVKSISQVVAVGFRNYSRRMSGYNAAVKLALETGITGAYPNYTLDYSKILITKGKLLNENDATVALDADQLKFTWTYDGNAEAAVPNDRAVLVAYCEALEQSLFTMAGGDRSTNTASINVGRFKGQEVHTWLAFMSPDGNKVSPSLYCGKVVVS